MPSTSGTLTPRGFHWPFPAPPRSVDAATIESAWREYRRTRAESARETLLQRYLRLVRYMASRVSRTLPSSVEAEELISAGLLGFLAALDAYDPTHGVDFGSYALTRIRGAMLDFVREMDPLGRVTRRRLRRAEQALTRLEQQFFRRPTHAEAAQHLGVSMDAYQALISQGAASIPLSLDQLETVEGEEESERAPRPRVSAPGALDALTRLLELERASELAGLVAALSPSQQLVLHLAYVEELNFREIGMAMDISESRAAQLHATALAALRHARPRTAFSLPPAPRRG